MPHGLACDLFLPDAVADLIPLTGLLVEAASAFAGRAIPTNPGAVIFLFCCALAIRANHLGFLYAAAMLRFAFAASILPQAIQLPAAPSFKVSTL